MHTQPCYAFRMTDPVEAEVTDRKPRNMLFLVAYDIADPQRLRRVAKTCEDYGVRVEKSVFECDLAPDDFELLWMQLEDVIDSDEDALVAYRICGSCADEIRGLGSVVRPEKFLAYIV
jgi:CRISPR-associated protein Cas2